MAESEAAATSPARPKYQLVKNTFDIIKNRVVEFSADTGLKKNVHRLEEFKKMQKLLKRIEKLLKTYNEYESEVEQHDPTTANIPEALEKTMQRLAMPRKKFVKATLKKINEMILGVQDHRLTRIRKQVCCLYSKYPRSPVASEHCFRFKPCSTKTAAIYGCTISSTNPQIKSRTLEFNFDDDTIRIALPSLLRINTALEFYKNLFQGLSHQLLTFQDKIERKEKLIEILTQIEKRRDFLVGIKDEIECRRKHKPKSETETQETKETKQKADKGIFLMNFFVPFSRFLELPSRSKLQNMLSYHKNLLLAKIEQLAIKNLNTSESSPQEVKRRQQNFASYEQRIVNNINFIQTVLECYPTPEKPPHCPPVEEKSRRFKPTDKKTVMVMNSMTEDGTKFKEYEFDENTQKLAIPKLDRLLAAKEFNKLQLEKFLVDQRNAQIIKELNKEVDYDNENDDQDETSKIRAQTQAQKKEEKKQKEVQRVMKEYHGYFGRITGLTSLINEQIRRIDEFQARKADQGPSDFYHHSVCHAKPEETEPFKKYQMAIPHQSICNSKATKTRMIAALEMYQKWLKEKQADMQFKEQVKRILKSLKEETEADFVESDDILDEDNEQFDEAQPQENERDLNSKPISYYIRRLLHNMELLEMMLKEYPKAEEDSHMISHKNLEPKSAKFFDPGHGTFDEQHTNELAKPKKDQLRNTLESFRQLMSQEKQSRIECQLGKPSIKLEQKSSKTSEDKKRNKRDDALKLLEQIERKVTGDIFDEIMNKLVKKLPKMIVDRKEPLMMSSNNQKLRNSAFGMLLAINGPPRDEEEADFYQSFSGIIGDFVLKTMMDSMNPIKNVEVKNLKQLKAIEKNQGLIKIANNLINKIQ